MSLLVPHGWELGLMVLGLMLMAAAAVVRGRVSRLRWPVRFGGLAVFVAGITLLFVSPTALVAQAPLAPVPHKVTYVREGAHVRLTITPRTQGAFTVDTFAPSYIALPAHRRVTLTIVSFSTVVSPPAAYYGKVQGTIGGVETVDGRLVSNVNVDSIAHTLTVPALGLNVPIPVATQGHPARVEVTFTTPATGTYEWLCMCPCGLGQAEWGYPMWQAGMMRGEIAVL